MNPYIYKAFMLVSNADEKPYEVFARGYAAQAIFAQLVRHDVRQMLSES